MDQNLVVGALGKDGGPVSVQFAEDGISSDDGQGKCLTASANFGTGADAPVQVAVSLSPLVIRR